MSEEFIIRMIPERIIQLGYNRYHTRYRDLHILANSTVSIAAFNELWFVIDDPPGLVIDSYYGIYDSTGNYIADSTHLHRGEIKIKNPDTENKRIKFVQVIIIN